MVARVNDKVRVAMSGGVDSSVAALILKEQGWNCTGVTMKLFDNEDIGLERESACCSLSDSVDARSVSNRLRMDHFTFNMSREFEERVVDKFVAEYIAGRTPNPCIDCNRFVKFENFFAKAIAAGHDYIATGHYARVSREASGEYVLRKARDASKDQSYVLYSMTQEQLSRVRLPLGDLLKSEVREMAAAHEFRNANKPESQDICFVPYGSYADFIERRTGRVFGPGDFLDEEGSVIGRHRGYIRYTIGQRRGLGMGFSERKFVCSKNHAENTVTLGDERSLYSKVLYADRINLITTERLDGRARVTARTRYRQEERPAVAEMTGDGIMRVEFDIPQRAIAAGQAVVLYSGDVVLGGGTIVETRTK
jgi:tRNA-specific 2-thiouridylase